MSLAKKIETIFKEKYDEQEKILSGVIPKEFDDILNDLLHLIESSFLEEAARNARDGKFIINNTQVISDTNLIWRTLHKFLPTHKLINFLEKDDRFKEYKIYDAPNSYRLKSIVFELKTEPRLISELKKESTNNSLNEEITNEEIEQLYEYACNKKITGIQIICEAALADHIGSRTSCLKFYRRYFNELKG